MFDSEPNVNLNELSLLEKAEYLQNLLISHATGGREQDDHYKYLRAALLSEATLKPTVPRFLISCRDLHQFWNFIQPKLAKYAERRAYIYEEFSAIFQRLENQLTTPSDYMISETLEQFDADTIYTVWQSALDRRSIDAEGAITSARTLLESVCKHILDDLKIEYPDDGDLPKLYRIVAKALNLAPDQHTEQIFKQILGGCQTVIEGLGAVRNKLGDAHGRGKLNAKPAPRHAELAVNLAGSMATFLIRTWENQKTNNDPK